MKTVAHPRRGANGAIVPVWKNWKFCYIYTEFNTQITKNPPFSWWNFTIWFLGPKNVIFSKFCPRYARDFMFNSQNLKPNLREMHFLGLKNTIFQKFYHRRTWDLTFLDASLFESISPARCILQQTRSKGVARTDSKEEVSSFLCIYFLRIIL